MRILVVSDSHGRNDNLFRVFKKETYDAVIHLGDSHDQYLEIERELYKIKPLCPIRFIRGNCDDDISYDVEGTAVYEDVRVFMCHGHRYHVHGDRNALAAKARAMGAFIALYGHTHLPDLEEINGVTVFNPGSITLPRQDPPRPSYGIIEIAKGKTACIEERYL